MDSYKMFIDGQAVDAISGKTMTVVDPGTGETFAQVPLADERDVDAAVKAARRAFDSGVWSGKSPQERADIVIRFADLIEANSGAMAVADSRSNGGIVTWIGGGLWVATNTLRNLAWYAANKFVWEEDVPVSGSVYAFGSNTVSGASRSACARRSRRGTCRT
jgi:aldehyde dehydrogenase (NAD+)